MSDDLVKRLRENCAGQPATVPWPHRVLHEAADRIEQLEADKRALVEALKPFAIKFGLDHQPAETVLAVYASDGHDKRLEVQLSDFRRAQETLAKHGGAR